MECKHPAYLTLAVAIAGTACGWFRSSPAEVVAAPIEVDISAAERLNPDDNGQSLPTVVHIYQLKSAASLERADAEQVYRGAKEVLGSDLLQMEEVTLSPGETLHRRIERDRSAKVVALVALFRRPTGVSWRAVADLPPASSRGALKFQAEGYRIERR